MNELLDLVDWSRAQFALTAMVHWLFVPLTIGLSVIVGVMETIWYKTNDERWLKVTKFWMTLFGINFACGVATGLILEFEFGTNWSNYSWFVGDIFGAPLAIEGIVAFFLESTFVAVMFFGWKKFSRGFHLAATWLTALGVVLSALWILVANAWMQYPAGTDFDPSQMRNEMVSFWDVALSPVAVNKFFHTVLSGWVLAAGFVVGVSCYLLLRGKNNEAARMSIKVGGWVGLAGIILTMWTGDGSAVEVARTQPMKLAAMEGLQRGERGQSLVALGFVNPDYDETTSAPAVYSVIEIPKGLSVLARHDLNAFVPGIQDIIEGVDIDANGDTINTVSYADRIILGRQSHQALANYHKASEEGDSEAMGVALAQLKESYQFFGYGYFSSPEQAVPPVAMTFYSFRIMVMVGGYLLLFFVLALIVAYKATSKLTSWWFIALGLVTIPAVWVCSEAGWVVAEVGRQPWVVQDLLPTRAAVSAVTPGSVKLTFLIFTILFIGLIIADVSILCRQINKASKENIIA